MIDAYPIVCPICNHDHLILKYEATYEYSYDIDTNAPGHNNGQELLPYLYDNREQKSAKQYIQCQTCGATYPCYLEGLSPVISAEAVQKAIYSAISQ